MNQSKRCIAIKSLLLVTGILSVLCAQKSSYVQIKFGDDCLLVLKPETTRCIDHFSYHATRLENDKASVQLQSGNDSPRADVHA